MTDDAFVEFVGLHRLATPLNRIVSLLHSSCGIAPVWLPSVEGITRMSITERELYFDWAVQYYAVGRFAVFAGVDPIAGTLLHHAVEMALKGYLLGKLSPDQVKTDFDHNLPRLWEAFKQSSSRDVRSYDAVVARLHQFETIRYPDHVALHGMQAMLNVAAPGAAGKARRRLPAPSPRYDANLPEIDTLLDAVFEEASVNPKFFVQKLVRKEAREYLLRENVTRFSG